MRECKRRGAQGYYMVVKRTAASQGISFNKQITKRSGALGNELTCQMDFRVDRGNI